MFRASRILYVVNLRLKGCKAMQTLVFVLLSLVVCAGEGYTASRGSRGFDTKALVGIEVYAHKVQITHGIAVDVVERLRAAGIPVVTVEEQYPGLDQGPLRRQKSPIRPNFK